jgi:hypothetical protein
VSISATFAAEFCSVVVSTITLAIIRANTERGEVLFPLPGVPISRAAFGAIGVTTARFSG